MALPIQVHKFSSSVITNEIPHAASSPAINLDRVNSLKKQISPITNECQDREGRRLRLWKVGHENFCGTVQESNGKVIFIPQNKIINPASNKSSLEALQRISTLEHAHWDLVYSEQTKEMTIWPHLVGAVKDDAIQEESSVQVIERKEKWQQPQFEEKKSTLGHIFKKSPGHLQHDTPQNRAYILSAVSSPRNRVGINNQRVEYYLKIMPDGTQAWAHIESGLITNGGCNQIPVKWVEDPNSRIGGRFIPLRASDYKLDKKSFKEDIRSNRLVKTYNSSHPNKPIKDLHQGFFKEVGGVENQTGLITNLVKELQSNALTEYSFFLPRVKGKQCLSESEIQQLIRELARGIYVYGAIPFFSLHHNPEMMFYPVIHPCYQNTFIGYVISMLDYYMKGFQHGRYYDQTFIDEWPQNPITDKNYLEWNSRDFRKLCKSYLGTPSFSLDDILMQLEKEEQIDSENTEVFLDGFNVRWRLCAKQNSIRKIENIFILDGDFDILFDIEGRPDPKSEKQVRYYQRLEKACSLLAKQIKEKAPALPHFQKLLEALNLSNFFIYYFNTLKKAGKIPKFDHNFCFQNDRICPTLFPPMNISKEVQILIPLVPLFQKCPKQKILSLLAYFETKATTTLIEAAVAVFSEELQRCHPKIFKKDEMHLSKTIAAAFLPIAKGRYQSTMNAIDQTLISMGIKKDSNEILTQDDIFSKLNELLERIEEDIKTVEEMIKRNKQNDRISCDEIKRLEEFKEDKKLVLEQKKQLENWFKDPLTILFKDASLVYHFANKSLKIEKETTANKIHIAGGCGIRVDNKVAYPDAMGHQILNDISDKLSTLPPEKTLPVSNPDHSGIVFKLSLEEFHVENSNTAQSAISYLYPPKQTMDENAIHLFDAIANQDRESFKKFSNKIQDWNTQDVLGVSIVHHAAAAQDPFFLNYLFEVNSQRSIAFWRHRVDFEAKDSQGYTALHYAARSGSQKCLQLLIEKVPQLLEALAVNKETPFYLAAQSNKLISVQTLLNVGASPNCKATSGINSLISAILHGREQIALELLKSKSLDIEYALLGNKRAIHFSVEMKMESVLQELIKKGANINAISTDLGYRPIHLAIKDGWKKGVQLLGKCPRIELNAKSAFEKTALDHAYEGNHYQIVEFLIANGASAIRRFSLCWFRCIHPLAFLWRLFWRLIWYRNKDLI